METKILSKVSQIFGDFLGYFENIILSKKCCAYYFGQLLKKIGLHVITSGHTGCFWIIFAQLHQHIIMTNDGMSANLECFITGK